MEINQTELYDDARLEQGHLLSSFGSGQIRWPFSLWDPK